LIRFWLLKLSQTHFKYIFENHGIFNPEFLSVLNPRAGPRKILFHANYVEVGNRKTAIPADFAQFICTRRMTLHTSFIDEPHRNNILKFIMGSGKALKEVVFVSNQREFCEFLVKVVNFGNSFLFFHSKFDDLVYHAHGNRP
jgi:hypothetical protein